MSPWQPMDALTDGSGALAARIARVRSGLAAAGGVGVEDVEDRVAASVAQLGLCARLVAPAMATVVLGSPVLASLHEMWWQNVLGGAFPLSMPNAGNATSMHEWITTGPVAELIDAVAALVPVSLQVLWGNVASAVNSAAGLIGSARSDLADAAHKCARELLADPVLNPSGSIAGPSFVRASCCLIYRVSGSTDAICSDCVLR